MVSTIKYVFLLKGHCCEKICSVRGHTIQFNSYGIPTVNGNNYHLLEDGNNRQ